MEEALKDSVLGTNDMPELYAQVFIRALGYNSGWRRDAPRQCCPPTAFH